MDKADFNTLTTGSTWENIWRMSWPMLLVMLLNFFVGLTDVYIAGFLGPEIQAIVGFVSQLFFIMVIVANAISIGTVALLSRAVGAGQHEDALDIARQSLLFGLVTSVVLSIVWFVFRDWIIDIAGFTGDTGRIAGDFFVVFSLALAPNYMVIISNAIFRSGGEVKLALAAMFLISIINICLNFLLVFGVAGIPGIGYRGIAVSTALAMFAGMLVCLLLLRKSRWKKIFSGRWTMTGSLIMRIMNISWPSAIIQVSWNAANIFLYGILGRLGEAGITGMAALTNGLRIEAALYLPAVALHMAGSVLTGQNLGAQQPERAERIGWKITWAGVLMVAVFSFPVFFWPELFASIVSRDSAVLAETARYLKITMVVEPFVALAAIIAGCLQGAGDTKGTMTVIAFSMFFIRLPLAYLFAVTLAWGAVGIWLSMAVSILFQGFGMVIRFRGGRWKTLRP